MKTLSKTIILMSALLACACSPEQKEDIFDVPQTGYTFFEADFDAVTLDGDQAQQLWEKEVGIGVYGSVEGNNEEYTLKKAFDGKPAGEFYGPKVSGETIMAYYPYSEDFSLFEGKLMYSLSPLQEFDGATSIYDQFLKYAGYAYAFNENSSRLKFGYASGVLTVEVRLSGNETVRGIELSAQTPIAGIGGVSVDRRISLSESGARTIVLDCGEGISSQDGGTYVKFPVVMPAGEYEGVTITLKLDGKNDVVSDLEALEVVCMDADACLVSEVVISNGLGGFEVEGDLEFEPRS